MSRGPGIYEIFSSTSPGGNSSGFQLFDDQESKQQVKISQNETAEPKSLMKKFGGYKPKILGDETDFIEIQKNPSPDQASSTSPSKAREVHNQFQYIPGLRPQTVTSKPWVVGDKNVPMVLGSSTDEVDIDTSNSEQHFSNFTSNKSAGYNDNYQSRSEANSTHSTLSTSTDTSTLVHQNSEDSEQGTDNHVLYQNGFNNEEDLRPLAAETDPYVHKTNGVGHVDSVGVYIPPPDYEEDEKTLDFNSDTDDPSDGGEEIRPNHNKAKTAIKVYEGEDLSHYLAEDEPQQRKAVTYNAPKAQNLLNRKSKAEAQKIKTTEKQSLFKQLSPNKSKRKSTGNAPAFNSVRSFSYADSKFGTKGKTMGKSLSSSNLGDESDIFLSANAVESSYESFLRSRHGDDLLSTENSVRVDKGQADQMPKLRHKDGPVWKKLTVRIKQKMSKSFSSKEQ